MRRPPLRSSRRLKAPITRVTIDMLQCAQALFIQEPAVQGQELVVLMEMTMRNLTTESGINLWVASSSV